jgi:hypothetical protein
MAISAERQKYCLAGPTAEAIVFGDCDARGDMRMIDDLRARYFIADDDVERLRPQVHALLLKHWRRGGARRRVFG